MIEKHYDTDWAKTKSRDLVRDMISRNLFKFRKPRDLKVLCFPGSTATEIFEVYDPLGIPRENITGLERDKRTAQIIEDQNLGINLVHQDLESYVERRNSLGYDVISLDFTGTISYRQMETFLQISKKQIRDNFIFHSANCVKRDGSRKGLYVLGSTKGLDKDVIRNGGNALEDFLSKQEESTNIANNKGDDFKDLKSEAYSRLIWGPFQGLDARFMVEFAKLTMGEAYYHMIAHLNEESKKRGINFEIDPDNLDNSDSLNIGRIDTFMRGIETMATHATIDYLKSIGLNGASQDQAIFAIKDSCMQRRFQTTKDFEKYSYISESGTPMIGDIYFFGYPRARVEKSGILVHELGISKGYVPDFRRLHKAAKNYTRAAFSFLNEDASEKLLHRMRNEERPFLGSASKPVLTKKRYLEERKSGLSRKEIQVKYRGWQNKPLPQWDAHIKMGTYDEKPIPEISEDDRDIELITEQEAKDLINSGIPAKEVYDTYPTSFTRGQLGAWQAWHTMRERKS